MVDFKTIKEKAKEIEKQHNLSYYEVLQRFMFERILERISVSKYNDNFILKGGLLLTAMFGVDNRTTKVNLEIDISTGDKVTPRELKYKYPLTFEDRSIMINSYNIETILSERNVLMLIY